MSFRRDERGNIAILFAVGFTLSGFVAAIALDAAALYAERRHLQGVVDLAAIAAAADPGRAETVAAEVLADAGFEDGEVVVTTGTYTADPAVAPAQRFIAGAAANAVQVDYRRTGTLYFAGDWFAPPTIGVRAMATAEPIVIFSVGSRLASLQGGLANTVLNQLLGSTVALGVGSYDALLDVDLDLLDFLDALALELGISAGRYDDILAASAGQGQIARAIAATLDGADRLAARTVANAIGGNGVVPLGRLLSLGGLGRLAIGSSGGDDLEVDVGALDLLAAAAGLGNGDRQAELQLGAQIPGLLGLTADLAVGDPPQGSWIGGGSVGARAATAQVRLRLQATVLGSGALLGIPIRLPLHLDLAPAGAVLTSATCPSAAHPNGKAELRVQSGAVRLAVGDLTQAQFADLTRTPAPTPASLIEVRLLGATVLKVLGSALVSIAQPAPQTVRFTSADIGAERVQTVSTTGIPGSLTRSLLDTLTLQVPVLGLGLSLNGLTALLRGILLPLTPTLDLTVDHLLEALGIGVGEADIRVHKVLCTHPVLVQ